MTAPDEAPRPPVVTSTAPVPWRSVLRYCLTVYLLVRMALFAMGVLAMGLLPRLAQGAVPGWRGPGAEPGWQTAVTGWERADALWYLRIASAGYRTDDGSAAFFPLYPMAARAVGLATGGHWLLGAYVVSNLALVAALVLLFRLTEREHSALRARRVVLLAAIFPTSFFFFAPYTESLFLALSVGTFLCVRGGRWWAGGLLGAAAALTRSPGLLLAPALLVEAIHQFRSQPPGRARVVGAARSLAATALVPLGTGLYLAYWGRFGGDWRRPFDAQKEGWDKHASWPWETLRDGFDAGFQLVGAYPGSYFLVDVLAVAVVMAAAVWATVRLRPSYALYVWASLLFPMFLVYDGRPFLSAPRLYVVVFPLFWAIAAFEARWRARDAVIAVSAAGFAVLGAAFVTAYPIF